MGSHLHGYSAAWSGSYSLCLACLLVSRSVSQPGLVKWQRLLPQNSRLQDNVWVVTRSLWDVFLPVACHNEVNQFVECIAIFGGREVVERLTRLCSVAGSVDLRLLHANAVDH